MSATPAPKQPTLRERYRAQVRAEVKEAALRQLAASEASMNLLLDVLRRLGDRVTVPPAQPLTSRLADWAPTHAFGIDPAVALRAILIWSRLHGLVSLEIAGNFTSMGIDPGELFEAQLPALTA